MVVGGVLWLLAIAIQKIYNKIQSLQSDHVHVSNRRSHLFDHVFSFSGLWNMINKMKRFFANIKLPRPSIPPEFDMEKQCAERIPFLRKEIRMRNDKIELIRNVIQSHPDLLAMSLEALKKFHPSTNLIKLDEYG